MNELGVRLRPVEESDLSVLERIVKDPALSVLSATQDEDGWGHLRR
jgi:hypothetical protein